ncbi:hypothetical protein FPQ18DRAFT_27686 [Pyronema domesticum]|nr:hypothetical protein FPQ18DRAFT_27686 [Pyronema domesticum]
MGCQSHAGRLDSSFVREGKVDARYFIASAGVAVVLAGWTLMWWQDADDGGVNSQLATRNWQLAIRNSQLSTRNSQPATRNSQLATGNSQLSSPRLCRIDSVHHHPASRCF